MKIYIHLLAFLLSVSWAAAQPPDLDAWVARTMKTFEVPGIAVAIVKDGEVVAARGYGVRKLGESAPVDANTIFGIASNTKAFTSAALAMLVDEGKIRWDDPVINHLPQLHLHDPYVTRELTVRDALSHRSGLGLGAGDLLYWPDTTFTRDEVVARARFIQPASSFRSRYAYSNLMFVIAGQIIPAVTGKSWDDFVRERILTPLGMTSTRLSSVGLRPEDNAAYPHSRGWRLRGTLRPVPMQRNDVWAAAAGIQTSVNDLSKWIIVQLNEGKIEQNRLLFSERQQREMWAATTVVPISNVIEPLRAVTPNFSSYGLGWAVRDYRGRRIISHGGGLTGMVTTVQLVPEENLGIVVLTNQEESGAFSSVLYHILDYYLGAPYTDWISAYEAARSDKLHRAETAEKTLSDARAVHSRPTLKLARYAARYRDPWYGEVSIKLEKSGLVLYFEHTPGTIADLEHWQYDTFRAVFRDNTVPDAFVTFFIGADGKIGSVKMEAVSDLADFSFDYQDLHLTPAP